MITNKSELRKKIKEANALKKNIHYNPFGISTHQMQRLEKQYERYVKGSSPEQQEQPASQQNGTAPHSQQD